MIRIREESSADIAAVRELNEQAFDQPLEANLVDALREVCSESLALVALDGEALVGHILFSPVVLDAGDQQLVGSGLAPMAVRPGRQRRGIGSALIREGLTRLREQGCPFVVVLGHADYYPRFGFELASLRGLRSQWQGVPDEAFMVAVLDERRMAGLSGVARYRPEFDAAV